jgi:hypothetical protein
MAAPRPEWEQKLLRRIDACVDRMRAMTPDEPYVLSIPQDEPKFHHPTSHSASMWLSGTPFRRADDEPNQQYQTFYYHEPLSDVFQLHRNSHYQKDNVDKAKDHDASTQSTPNMLPKKKISLAAYANKKSLPDTSDSKPVRNRTLHESTSTSSSSLKSRDSFNLPRILSPLQFPQHHLPPKPPPVQKQPPPPPPPSQQQQKQAKQPLLPPSLISPTLPASILASLDAKPYQPSRHKHATKRLPSPPPRPAPEKSRKPPPNIPDPETRDSPQETDQDSARPSLIVKLRIPKTLRKNLGRYLQMKPQKTIRVVPPEKPPAVATQSAKRPRIAEEDAPLPESKRKKAVDADTVTKQESATPIMPVTPAAQKETPSTRNPKKDLRASVAMKRVESADGMANGTPSSSRQLDATTKSSPSAGSVKTAESHAWEIEAARIGKIGRDLKHAATDVAKNKANHQPHVSEMAAALAIESFLSFILSFYCTERGLASRNPPSPLDPVRTWLTLPGFIRFVRSHCQHFPVLEGVACHLGVVSNAMILLRLTSNRPADMAAEDTGALRDAASASLKASREGNAKLSLSTLISTFPKTWKKALNGPGSGTTSDENVKPGHFAGHLSLPLGLDTEPLVAVRVGYSLLREWCASRGLKYEMKLCL